MQFKDYYEILGVPAGAATDVIKTAYRRLARKFHPDVSKEKGAEEKFKSINEAYEVLHDPKKRAHYDELRARGYRPGEEYRPQSDYGSGHAGARPDFDFGDVGSGGFSDFFESLFGRGRGGPGPGGGQRRPTEARANLAISLEAAFAGSSERISIGGRTLDVKIPAGIQSGQAIRLAGQADGGGDLMLEISYLPHAVFKVDKRNVTAHVSVAPWEAALGAKIKAPTLGGVVELRVPPGSASGSKLRLKGRGLPGTPPGDQFVIFDVNAPVPATAAQRTAYEKLAESFANPTG